MFGHILDAGLVLGAGKQKRDDATEGVDVSGRVSPCALDLFGWSPGNRVSPLESEAGDRIVPEFANAEISNFPGVVAPKDVLRLDVAMNDVVFSGWPRETHRHAG